MFDYRLDEEKNDNLEYIRNYFVNRDNPNELLVHFVDECVVIDNSYENIEKLDRIMEEQMIRAIENREKFKKERDTMLSGAISSVLVGLGICYCNIFDDSFKDVSYILLEIGMPSLSAIVLIDCVRKIKEIDKAKFLLENKDLLLAYEEYSLSLKGVSEKCRDYLRRNDEPFKMNDLYLFSINDLKKIVHNIRKKDHFGFTYTKKYKR